MPPTSVAKQEPQVVYVVVWEVGMVLVEALVSQIVRKIVWVVVGVVLADALVSQEVLADLKTGTGLEEALVSREGEMMNLKEEGVALVEVLVSLAGVEIRQTGTEKACRVEEVLGKRRGI